MSVSSQRKMIDEADDPTENEAEIETDPPGQHHGWESKPRKDPLKQDHKDIFRRAHAAGKGQNTDAEGGDGLGPHDLQIGATGKPEGFIYKKGN